MERNIDLRRATVSAANGLPRRRQRITTLRDSNDQDRQMELHETVRLGDREKLQEKEREREFPKRRRIDSSAAHQRSDGGESCRENESTDSSDEEYYEEEEEVRIHQHNRVNQFSPKSSSLSNNRRGLRSLRSSPVLRAASDEIFGVPVPRRARSSLAKRLHEYCNSGSGGFGEDMSHRRYSPLLAAVIGSGDSMKKKMKSPERRTPISNAKHSAIQDDIEIEVAEALFDLMKQSQSQSQSQSRSSQRQEKIDRDRLNKASNELKISKADGGKDENNAFLVQNEPTVKVNAGTDLGDSVNEPKKKEERFPDDPAQELVSGDGFVNKVKVGSPKESESPSCLKVNACDIQDPTVTKAHYDAIIVEAKKETKLEIDLMSSPLPSSPEREGLVDLGTDSALMAQAGRKKSEVAAKDGRTGIQIEKIGVISRDQQSNLDVEKHSHQQQDRKENKNQSPTSLLPFPVGMSSWLGVLPHPGFMQPMQAMPINGTAKSSMIMQPPQFKFSQPRPKRCVTHQFLAQSIHCHQQLIKKSLSTGPTALYGSKSPSLKYTSPAQSVIPGNPFAGEFQGGQNLATGSVGSGKDDAVVALNATTSTKSLLQQASHSASASSFLHGHGFLLPFGHHQTTIMAATNSSGTPQSAISAANATLMSNSAWRPPINFPLPNASTALSLNHPMFPSNEASPYMAILQNNGCSIPISTNISMPSFKGGSPSMPFFNSSLYPSPAFNLQQFTTSHASAQSSSQNTNLSSHRQPQSSAKTSENNKFPTTVTANQQSEKPVQPSYSSSKSEAEISWKNGALLAPGVVSHSAKPSNSQPMNYAMFPPASVGGGGGGAGNKQIDPPQQGSKGRVELIPQAYAFSFASNASATPVLNFSSMAQSSGMFQMLPDICLNGDQMIHQKNFRSSEGKSVASGGQSFNYSRSDCSEISALSTMGSPKVDGLARTTSYLPSSLNGSQQFQMASGVSVSNFQQHQLSQVQDHHMHQMHVGGTSQVKSSTPHNIHGSFLTGILPSSSSSTMFATNDAPSYHLKWENFPRSAAPESTTSNIVNIPQLKSSQGQTHISFGNGPFQGHQFVMKSESSMSRNASSVGLTASTTPPLPSQEAEGQKSSSPACRRNVPSILGTCPSQLPELKY